MAQKLGSRLSFPVKLQDEWADETATTSDAYDASNPSSVLVPLRLSPFEQPILSALTPRWIERLGIGNGSV